MTDIDWTAAECEAVADQIAKQYLHLRDGRSVQIATGILAALTPSVEARVRQAKAEGRVEALREAISDPAIVDYLPPEWVGNARRFLRDRAAREAEGSDR